MKELENIYANIDKKELKDELYDNGWLKEDEEVTYGIFVDYVVNSYVIGNLYYDFGTCMNNYMIDNEKMVEEML